MMYLEQKTLPEPQVKELEIWQKGLLKAADLIAERGLAKCVRELNGRLCVQGAISLAVTGRSSWDNEITCLCTEKLADYLTGTGVRNAFHRGCGLWNNERDRTKEQVIFALRETVRLG